MKKFIHILKGWSKALGIISTTKAEAKLSEMRLRICRFCDHAKRKKVLQVINDEAIYEHSLLCEKCKCPCLEKSLVVDESCPLSKW